MGRLSRALLPMAFMLAAGCSEEQPQPPKHAAIEVVKSPLGTTLTVILDRVEISIAETLHMDLVAVYSSRAGFIMPSLGSRFGEWRVVDESKVERMPVGDGKIEARRRYTLEPYLPGDYVIPEINMILDSSWEVVRTPEIPVLVTSVLDGGVASAKDTELVPPHEDQEIPGETEQEVSYLWWWIGGGTILALAAAATAMSLCRKRQEPQEQPSDRELLAAELEEVLGHDKLDGARLSEVANRADGVPGELRDRIEQLVFSAGRGSSEQLLRAAEELRVFIIGKEGRV